MQKSSSRVSKKDPRRCEKGVKGSKTDVIPDNPWPHAETVPLLLETSKFDIKDLEQLECHTQFQISTVKLENEQARDNELYRIFGAMMNQDSRFMRQWLFVYVLPH